MSVNKFLMVLILTYGICGSANADVWSWIDAKGDMHFVDTIRPIYTWQDDYGKVFFSDKPDHVNAVSVELVWHSTGSLDDIEEEKGDKPDKNALLPGETEAEREERRQAEAYYCKRATEIYDSYVNAPRLYKTGEDGKPEYLSDEDAAQTIAETKAKVDELCN